MRMLIATLLVLAGACTGATPAGSRTCAGNLYTFNTDSASYPIARHYYYCLGEGDASAKAAYPGKQRSRPIGQGLLQR